MNRFEIRSLPPKDASRYWDNILSKGLTASYGEYPAQIGHPIELDPKFVEEINKGAQICHRIIVDKIKAAGGITEWMKQRPVTFGPHNLNNPEINTQLEKRLAQGYGLPLVYDVLVTQDKGRPKAKVLEIQTVIGYETTLEQWLQAAGYNPNDNQTRFGKEQPKTRYSSLPTRFTQGEPIIIMDTAPLDAFSITRVDKVGMQQMVGSKEDLPISPLDIVGKDVNGYYYHPYIKDPEKPFDVKRDTEGNPQKDTSVKKYIQHVLARMTQSDLDMLWQKVKNDRQQTALVTQFLNDSSINWLIHPTWQHLSDKAILPRIREQLLRENNPIVEQFVPIYGAGERIVEPGRYIKKPTDAYGGAGHSQVTVEKRDTVVEDGYVYQQLLTPYPILSYVPGRFAAEMRKSNQSTLKRLDREAGENPRPITGQLEVRCIIPPYWDGEIFGRNMARYAPRWDSPDTLTRTQTNIIPTYKALHRHLANTDNGPSHKFYPYGFAPVVVFEEDRL